MISQIRLNNADVFLVTEWEKNTILNLKIINIDEREAYQGQVTEIDLQSQAAKIRLPFTDFIRKARDALSPISTQTNYLYSLDQFNGSYIFKWKSIDLEETIISLGSIDMKNISFNSLLSQFLLSVANDMKSLKSSMENLNQELSTHKSQLSSALTKLSNANDLKDSLEKELYSKFVLVLNEKKRRIRELEGMTTSLVSKKKEICPKNNVVSSKEFMEKEVCPKNNVVSSKEFKKKEIHRRNVVVSSDDSDTDLEKVPKATTDTIKEKEINPLNMLFSSSESDIDGELENDNPGPSNAKGLNNSLQFDDDVKLVPLTKIRKRNMAPLKNVFPVSPCHSTDKNNLSDDGSFDSLMELL